MPLDAARPSAPTVLLVAHHYPPHIGGMEVVVHKQAESMARSGFRVVVLTSKAPPPPQPMPAQDGIAVVRIPCWHFIEQQFFVPFPLFSPRLFVEAWKQVRQADVVHIHDVFYMSSWVSGLLAVMAGKPLFLTQHVAMVEHSSSVVMLAQRLVYATVGRWLFAKAHRIVAYNKNVQAFLVSRGVADHRIMALTNGIDTDVFRPAEPGERNTIRTRMALPIDRPLVLFVGRLVEKKGVHILLEARDSNFDVIFAGPGPVPEQGRVEGIHWLGPLDQKQTADLYRACDLFAFPAVGEIFTLVMQEALSSGLPVLTTDDPAYAGSVVADCIVLCRRDIAAFRAAIHSLLRDENRTRNMSTKSREVAMRHFDWNSNFSRLAAAYSDITREQTQR